MNERVVAKRYQLVRLLGRGGMGTVWLAQDTLAGRMVAVKELRASAGLDDSERDVAEKRALQEARSAAQIQHPNAVTLFDVIPAGADDDAIYLIMEYVDGVTLAQAIQRDGRVSEQQAAALCLQLLSVLAEAHRIGIVHRDIKPANVMIAKSGQAKLADFGIAHTTGATRLTGSGVIGTPSYMAPELFESGEITPAADLWSLGATLYHAVEGRSPFERETTAAVLRALLLDPLPRVTIPGSLGAAVTGMLARDPANRLTVSQARRLLEAETSSRGYSPTETVLPERQQPPVRQSAATPRQESGTARPPAGQRLADHPSSQSTIFTSAPGHGKYGIWVALLVLGTAIGAVVLGALARSGILIFAGIALFCVAPVGYRSFMNRYPLLMVSPAALSKKGGTGPARQIPWRDITRLGPVSEDGRSYMYAWLKNGHERVQLCPLEAPSFPPEEIRAAIVTHCPTVNIDPI